MKENEELKKIADEQKEQLNELVAKKMQDDDDDDGDFGNGYLHDRKFLNAVA